MTSNSVGPTSVRIERIAGYNHALAMTWTQQPQANDINIAFGTLLEVLDAAKQTVHIVVDVQAKPDFPLHATIVGAMQVQGHTYMGKWLVIGANRLSKTIGSAITTLGKDNIEWFTTSEDAYNRLRDLQDVG